MDCKANSDKAGLRERRPAKKPLISKNRVARMKFAKEHEHLTVRQWTRILFSDETKNNLPRRMKAVIKAKGYPTKY
uniref:Transposase Tc1-like domain-containing protein n=1 Tax=Acrobeloides nanus TaxID=290746 RepID=A0A914CXB8_9BILA